MTLTSRLLLMIGLAVSVQSCHDDVSAVAAEPIQVAFEDAALTPQQVIDMLATYRGHSGRACTVHIGVGVDDAQILPIVDQLVAVRGLQVSFTKTPDTKGADVRIVFD